MKIKQATEICKNINAENLLIEDKFEAIQTLLNSQNPTYRLTNPDMLRIIEFLMQRNTPETAININTEMVFDKEYALFGQCPKCGREWSADIQYCPNCGQALDWRDGVD